MTRGVNDRPSVPGYLAALVAPAEVPWASRQVASLCPCTPGAPCSVSLSGCLSAAAFPERTEGLGTPVALPRMGGVSLLGHAAPCSQALLSSSGSSLPSASTQPSCPCWCVGEKTQALRTYVVIQSPTVCDGGGRGSGADAESRAPLCPDVQWLSPGEASCSGASLSSSGEGKGPHAFSVLSLCPSQSLFLLFICRASCTSSSAPHPTLPPPAPSLFPTGSSSHPKLTAICSLALAAEAPQWRPASWQVMLAP